MCIVQTVKGKGVCIVSLTQLHDHVPWSPEQVGEESSEGDAGEGGEGITEYRVSRMSIRPHLSFVI